MPTYEYHCRDCGQDFEVVQSIKADALTVCTCGKGGRVDRRISGGAGIIFKGSGFYETDYRRAAGRPDGEGKGGEGKKGETPPAPSTPAAAPAPATGGGSTPGASSSTPAPGRTS